MGYTNIELKARCSDHSKIKNYLRSHGADFKGVDHQIDTYFNVPNGRLKLREGNIENYLVHYDRPDHIGPKPAHVSLHRTKPGNTAALKETLTMALGVLTVVDKHREIYFIENVKFHVDRVDGLVGTFMEIEAIDFDGSVSTQRLREQCEYYLSELGIKNEDQVVVSYSDLLKSL
jgi:adenylate cyclase, class 2